MSSAVQATIPSQDGGGGLDDDTTAPSTPSNVAGSGGTGKISLSWDAVEAADLAGYAVYRSTTSMRTTGKQAFFTEGPVPVSGEKPVSSPSFTDSDIVAEKTYYYYVTALDSSFSERDLSAEASASASTGSDNSSPAAPSGLTASSGDYGIDLSWSGNSESDVEDYNVYRESSNSTAKLSNPVLVNRGQFVDKTSFTDFAVESGTEYSYEITAVDSSRNESAVSSTVSATFDGGSSGRGGAFVQWLPDQSSWTFDVVEGSQPFEQDPSLSYVYNSTDSTNGEFDVAGYLQGEGAFYSLAFTNPSLGDPPKDAPLAGITQKTSMDPNHNPVFTLRSKVDPEGAGISYMVISGNVILTKYNDAGSILTLKVKPVQYALTDLARR